MWWYISVSGHAAGYIACFSNSHQTGVNPGKTSLLEVHPTSTEDEARHTLQIFELALKGFVFLFVDYFFIKQKELDREGGDRKDLVGHMLAVISSELNR